MSQPEPAPKPQPAPAGAPAYPQPGPADLPAYPQAIHLRPTAALAERVLLPGDPGRALALAQTLLEKPLMFNHHRGLWGYTGAARADGEPLTIQATGMGGPSAAIVLTELIALGARRAIRVGTCGALAPGLALGDLLIARESICRDGTSREIARGDRRSIGDPVDLRSVADPKLTQALVRSAPAAHAGTIVSVDLFYDKGPFQHPADALAIEMEAATLFAVGAAASVPVACVLVVSDTFELNEPHPPMRTHIDDAPLLQAAGAMGAVAVAALSA